MPQNLAPRCVPVPSFSPLTVTTGNLFPRLDNILVAQGSCCCDCVPLSRGPRGGIDERKAGAPETFRGGFPSEAAGGGRGGFRPRHRRGWSTGGLRVVFSGDRKSIRTKWATVVAFVLCFFAVFFYCRGGRETGGWGLFRAAWAGCCTPWGI